MTSPSCCEPKQTQASNNARHGAQIEPKVSRLNWLVLLTELSKVVVQFLGLARILLASFNFSYREGIRWDTLLDCSWQEG
jgi:hypothetical protein